MIKVPQIVESLFYSSDTAQLASAENLLNVSAFAEQIQDEVESQTKKEVQVSTIRAALYRLLEKKDVSSFKPEVKLSQLSIHPSVIDITYPRTHEILQKVERLIEQIAQQEKNFFTFTQGPEELTIIVDVTLKDTVLDLLGTPKALLEYLTAVSVRFSDSYLAVPNMMYTVFASLAVKQINILEVVSTYTSLTFVIDEQQMNETLEALKKHLR